MAQVATNSALLLILAPEWEIIKTENDSTINKIILVITSFFINKKILDKTDDKNSLVHVYATEFKTKAFLGYNTIGI